MIYFASDFHLGMPLGEVTTIREKKIVRWLDAISKDATQIFLLGDLFDFWFEYKSVVPRGFVRFLGKLAELSDKGIQIHVCVGNHDLWMYNYLEKECGVRIFRSPEIHKFNETSFYLHHGDGLGPGDSSYKFLKKVFLFQLNIWLFSKLHPNLGFKIASGFSKKSRLAKSDSEKEYLGDDKEFLMLHCQEIAKKNEEIDYFIFGHRHLVIDREVKLDKNDKKVKYINLGEWFSGSTYAKFDGQTLFVEKFES